jgi:hypothetical protein
VWHLLRWELAALRAPAAAKTVRTDASSLRLRENRVRTFSK